MSKTCFWSLDMKNEIIIHDENDLRSKIYTIRGQQVMLDFDLAEIYGYSVKAFNQQVKNNIEKFDSDFMFQLNENEFSFLRSKILTSKIETRGGRQYFPYAFTEQGVYMLMTVLRGELAIKQSKVLVRLFKTMKDYIIESENLIGYKEVAMIAIQTSQNTKDIAAIKENMVTKDELSDFIKLFDSSIDNDEILILDGEPFKADLAYQKIYANAVQNIIVIDDYLGLKTLHHLAHAKKGVHITIISDNKGNMPLKLSEFNDFSAEYPDTKIKFITSSGRVHDRYIAVDFGTENEKLYHCGASSKDAGRKITTITEIKGISDYRATLKSLLLNKKLLLKP